jgi:ABC-type transport system involved in cytochrome c biogenesis permease subunit
MASIELNFSASMRTALVAIPVSVTALMPAATSSIPMWPSHHGWRRRGLTAPQRVA